jgi:hypothetical protein
MEQKYSIHRRNHVYGGNKNLGRGTNQDYMRNKKLVCGTKLWLENMEEKNSIRRTNHDYRRNKHLCHGTNQDFTGNKKFVRVTKYD